MRFAALAGPAAGERRVGPPKTWTGAQAAHSIPRSGAQSVPGGWRESARIPCGYIENSGSTTAHWERRLCVGGWPVAVTGREPIRGLSQSGIVGRDNELLV